MCIIQYTKSDPEKKNTRKKEISLYMTMPKIRTCSVCLIMNQSRLVDNGTTSARGVESGVGIGEVLQTGHVG